MHTFILMCFNFGFDNGVTWKMNVKKMTTRNRGVLSKVLHQFEVHISHGHPLHSCLLNRATGLKRDAIPCQYHLIQFHVDIEICLRAGRSAKKARAYVRRLHLSIRLITAGSTGNSNSSIWKLIRFIMMLPYICRRQKLKSLLDHKHSNICQKNA